MSAKAIVAGAAHAGRETVPAAWLRDGSGSLPHPALPTAFLRTPPTLVPAYSRVCDWLASGRQGLGSPIPGGPVQS